MRHGFLFPFAIVLAFLLPLSVSAQPLVLPAYPADRLPSLLASRTQADGPIFRTFLAEVVYACALSRDDSARTPDSVDALRTGFARYPDLVRWLNGGLPSAIASADLENLLGDGRLLQARVDSLLDVGVAAAAERRYRNVDIDALRQALPESLDPFTDPEARGLVLGVLERRWSGAIPARRRQMLQAVLPDSLLARIVAGVNYRLSAEVALDFGSLVDLRSISAGMPPEYADLLDMLLGLYYSRFEDRHRMAIAYLLADTGDERMAAMFQASGPALQKLFQLMADYTNDTRVRAQLNRLKSGVHAYGERDIRPVIDAALEAAVDPNIRPRIQVDYDALASGTIGQAHVALLDPGTPRERRFIIKVKRPGLQEAVGREMAMFDDIAATPFARKILRDVRATLDLEMDLGREARELDEAARVYQHPRISVARAVDFVTPSRDIVAIDFVDARTLDRVNEKLDAVSRQIDRRHQVNRTIAEHYMANLLAAQADALNDLIQLWFEEALFGSGFFHGDLHSGNVFMILDPVQKPFEERFLGRHRLVLIDFGNTGRFTRDQQKGVVEFMAAVARKNLQQTLDGLVRTGTIKESDRPALRDTVASILGGSELTTVKTDRIATVGYAEGSGDTRDLLSFTRARILLETQLNDVNRRLDLVDPNVRYPRYTPWTSYPEVVKPHVIGHCLMSLVGFRSKGDRIISCSEARVLQKASSRDLKIMVERGDIPLYPDPLPRRPRVVLHLRGGASRESISGIGGSGPRWSWHVGLGQHYAIGHHAFFQPEIQVASQGYVTAVGGSDATVRIHSVRFPLLGGRRFLSGWTTLYAGPQLGLILGGRRTSGGSDVDIDNELKPLEFAAAAGATVGLPKGFALDVRYTHGLTDISETASDLRTRSFQVSLVASLARIGRLTR